MADLQIVHLNGKQKVIIQVNRARLIFKREHFMQQYWGLAGIALCGISNTSTGNIF